MAFFEGNKMTGGYGNGPDIINSCSVSVDKGEIVSILGPNGAGKSTAMKAMLGLLNLKSGSVIIDGKDITQLSPQDRVKSGISFVPQTKNVFAGMTVEENLEMGAFLISDSYNSVINEIYELFPRRAKTTSCTWKGTNDQTISFNVRWTNRRSFSNCNGAKQALSISDRGYVLVTGENRYSGSGKELLNDPRVRSSFLGG